jgi:hypothetical protein
MDWRQYPHATCWPDCWCEAPRLGAFILEPVNSWTNLAFVFAGIYFILTSRNNLSQTNYLTTHQRYPRTYGGALIFLGLGSFFYHASQTFVGQWFDVFGMYLVSVYFVVYNFLRLGVLKEYFFLKTYFLACVALGLIIIFFPDLRRWLFGASIVLILFQLFYINRLRPRKLDVIYLFISILSYATGQIFWLLDKYKIWCWPHGLINGHGLWHIFTGISAVSIFFYFKSEEAISIENHSGT